ncbi:DUF433 domain-containing protein [Haloechinothrix halophila]|nr:DUF433 domain-containing protein [Haloechinothrix halophila]
MAARRNCGSRSHHHAAGGYGGQPCIRGMRFPVKTIVHMVAQGMSTEQILAEHPDLEAEDVRQALEFAAASLDADSYLPLRHSA